MASQQKQMFTKVMQKNIRCRKSMNLYVFDNILDFQNLEKYYFMPKLFFTQKIEAKSRN